MSNHGPEDFWRVFFGVCPIRVSLIPTEPQHLISIIMLKKEKTNMRAEIMVEIH